MLRVIHEEAPLQPVPSMYIISTITVLMYINVPSGYDISFLHFFQLMPVLPQNTVMGIVRIDFIRLFAKKKKENLCYQRYFNKIVYSPQYSSFPNKVSFLFRFVHNDQSHEVDIYLFSNGNMRIAGVKNTDSILALQHQLVLYFNFTKQLFLQKKLMIYKNYSFEYFDKPFKAQKISNKKRNQKLNIVNTTIKNIDSINEVSSEVTHNPIQTIDFTNHNNIPNHIRLHHDFYSFSFETYPTFIFEKSQKNLSLSSAHFDLNTFVFETKIRPTMYNTSFDLHFPVNLLKLHYIIYYQYDLKNSVYEPDCNQFAKICFYWNSNYLKSNFKPGICYCDIMCDGSQCGNGNGNCKKITASVYESGKVSISGANHQDQVVTMYNFLNSIFRLHYDDIYLKKVTNIIQDDITDENDEENDEEDSEEDSEEDTMKEKDEYTIKEKDEYTTKEKDEENI